VSDDFLHALAARGAAYTPAEAAITRHCFRALLAGVPAAVADLEDALALSSADVQKAVAALGAGGALGIEHGVVNVAGGLSQPPTAHRLVLDGAVRHVCCAVDAVGIPAALGGVARVDSRCEACRASITVTLAGGRPASTPDSVVIWAANVDSGRSVREYT
jgi:hypothetical protein